MFAVSISLSKKLVAYVHMWNVIYNYITQKAYTIENNILKKKCQISGNNDYNNHVMKSKI